MTIEAAPKAHAELGASVAKRWMSCPGSVRLVRSVPTPPSTEYAQEGTAAHALAETCLRRNYDPSAFHGTTFEGFVVDEAMADAVRVYVNHCRALADQADEFWIEQQFTLAAFKPPTPMFGTCDFVAYRKDTKTLTVCDLKFGQGVLVEAIGNPQLRYYALGAALVLAGYEINTVEMYIVQPRAAHPDGAIRCDTIDIMELLQFAGQLLDAAHRTQDGDAPLHAGDHCRFCPAAAVCPEQLRHAQEVAQVEFAMVPAVVPPPPATLSVEQLAEFLPKLDILDEWINAVRAHARALLERGEEVPGVKLVAKRPTRKWIDAQEYLVATRLQERGYTDDDYCEPQELKSPAQVEKLLGKKMFRQLMEELVIKRSSGLSMVAADDPRPAVQLTAGEEFLALPPGRAEEE